MHAYRDQYAQLFKDGKNVVLIGFSVDADTMQQSWMRDDQMQFLMVSDTGGVVGKQYGAFSTRGNVDNRNLFVVGPDGKIAYVAAPFRESDPTAYTMLAEAINKLVPADTTAR
jgi:peroxiredoxin